MKFDYWSRRTDFFDSYLQKDYVDYDTPTVRYRARHPESTLKSSDRDYVHYTVFIWDDEDGTKHEISREDVGSAFRFLIDRYEEVELALNDLRCDLGCTMARIFKHDVALTRRAGDVAACLVVCSRERYLLASRLSDYIDVIQDAADQGRVPTMWRRYPGALDLASAHDGPEPLDPLEQISGLDEYNYHNRISDFGFRLCHLLNLESTEMPEDPLFTSLLEEAIALHGYMIGKRARPESLGTEPSLDPQLEAKFAQNVTIQKELNVARSNWDEQYPDKEESHDSEDETPDIKETSTNVMARDPLATYMVDSLASLASTIKNSVYGPSTKQQDRRSGLKLHSD